MSRYGRNIVSCANSNMNLLNEIVLKARRSLIYRSNLLFEEIAGVWETDD